MSIVIEKATRKGNAKTTASGYGSKLRTSIMVYVDGKWRRIYAICYGNAPSIYINVRGKRIFISECDIPEIREEKKQHE